MFLEGRYGKNGFPDISIIGTIHFQIRMYISRDFMKAGGMKSNQEPLPMPVY